MNIRDLQYLIAVNNLKNFSQAAKQCFVSQPALSQQIKKIEEELGFDIFERDKKEIITTSKGEEVIKYANLITNYYDKIKEVSHEEQHLKIALIPTICPYLLPKIIDHLHKEFPKTKFYFLELKTEDLLKKLKEGEIDMGILAYFEDIIDDKLYYQKSYDEEFFLALPKNSKLTQKDFPQILEEKSLILLEEGNCLSENVKDICSLYNKSKKSQNNFNEFYATNIETVKNMIKINNGAALLPKLACENEQNLKLLPFKPKRSREVGLVCRNSFTNKKVFREINKIIASI